MASKKRTFLFLLVLFLFSYSFCFSQNKMNGPVKIKTVHQEEEYGRGENPVVNFYQNWISPAKGGNGCVMFPSCSQYAKIAFQKYSSLKAFALTCDRLMRCGHELYLYKTIIMNNEVKFYDPVPKEDSVEK